MVKNRFFLCSPSTQSVLQTVLFFFLFYCGIIVFPSSIFATTLAFPGAEGYGKNAAGGRGGVICRVTNLNNSGAGSLRTCLTNSGARTVVFDVGGVITLDYEIDIMNPYITIAGQTAPGDGIAIRGAPINLKSHDIIIRHLRLRNGVAGQVGGSDNLQILGGANSYNIIIDHCSISWHDDEGISLYIPATDVTLSYNIISESLQDGHGIFTTGSVSGQTGTRLSIHHNLLAHNAIRNPVISGGEVDVINNVIYNNDSQQPHDPDWALYNINYIGNYYLPGPDSDYYNVGLGSSMGKVVNFRNSNYGAVSSVYLEGNISPNRYYLTQPETDFYTKESAITILSSPLDHSPITTTTAFIAFEDVLNNAGATLGARDSTDTRVVATVRNGTGAQIMTIDDVGGFPTYNTGTPPTDADSDGMPDTWEVTYGLDPAVAGNNDDSDGDGYTNLEEYLNNSYPISPLFNFSQSSWEYTNTLLPINGIAQFYSRGTINTSTSSQLTIQPERAEKITNPGFDSNVSNWTISTDDIGDSPTTIPNLSLWFKADAITGLADGETVATWNDSSGNGTNATQLTSGNRPLYRTSAVAGYPTVDFDGTSDSFSFSSTNFSDLTLFVVNKPSSFTFNTYIGQASGNSAIYQYDNDSFMFRSTSAAALLNGYGISTTQFFLHTARITSGTAEQFINGLTKGSIAIAGTFTFNQIGAWGGGGSQYLFHGQIAEIIVYSSALTDNQKAEVESYLASKYNLINPNATDLTQETTTTYRYTEGAAQIDTQSISQVVQDVSFDDTRTYTLKAYVKTDGSAVSAADVELYFDGNVISTTYTAAANGWYLLSGKVAGSTSAKSLGFEVKANKTIYIDQLTLETYPTSATLVSSVFDVGFGIYGGLATYTVTQPSGSNAQVKIRTANNEDMSDAMSFDSCSPLQSGVNFSTDSCVVAASRYFQYSVTLTPSTTSDSPTFLDTLFTLNTTAPTVSTSTTQTSASSTGPFSTCHSSAPTQSPRLFGAIRETPTTTRLYFSKIDGLGDGHFIQYGTDSGLYMYATKNIGPYTSGSTIISHLNPAKKYYFRIMAVNGCAPGPWSSEISDTPIVVSKSNFAVETSHDESPSILEEVSVLEETIAPANVTDFPQLSVTKKETPIETPHVSPQVSQKTRPALIIGTTTAFSSIMLFLIIKLITQLSQESAHFKKLM